MIKHTWTCITQYGSGLKCWILSWRSTQKPRVGVWQGPNDIRLLSRLPYLPYSHIIIHIVSYVYEPPLTKLKAKFCKVLYAYVKEFGLKSRKCTANAQVQFLARIYWQCFISIGRNKVLHSLFQVHLRNGTELCTINYLRHRFILLKNSFILCASVLFLFEHYTERLPDYWVMMVQVQGWQLLKPRSKYFLLLCHNPAIILHSCILSPTWANVWF